MYRRRDVYVVWKNITGLVTQVLILFKFIYVFIFSFGGLGLNYLRLICLWLFLLFIQGCWRWFCSYNSLLVLAWTPWWTRGTTKLYLSKNLMILLISFLASWRYLLEDLWSLLLSVYYRWIFIAYTICTEVSRKISMKKLTLIMIVHRNFF